MNELSIVETLKPIEIFTPQGVDEVIDRIAAEARAVVLDISTVSGRKHVASLAYKIAKSKTFLDEAGKALVSGWKDQAKVVDAERKRIRDSLDALRDEIRAPLTEWETREANRIQAHETAIGAIVATTVFESPHPSSATIQSRLDSLEGICDRDWQEFENRAGQAREKAGVNLVGLLISTQEREAERAELERLQREEAERKRRDREERIRAEAAAKAKEEAEARAKEEAEREAARVKAVADAEATRVKSEALKAEQARLATERAKQEAEQRAAKEKADRIAAEEKAREEAKTAAEKAEREKASAVQAERDRAKAVAQAEVEATAMREADRKHKARINNEAMAAFVSAGLSEADARTAVAAVAKGLVPHVKIQY